MRRLTCLFCCIVAVLAPLEAELAFGQTPVRGAAAADLQSAVYYDAKVQLFLWTRTPVEPLCEGGAFDMPSLNKFIESETFSKGLLLMNPTFTEAHVRAAREKAMELTRTSQWETVRIPPRSSLGLFGTVAFGDANKKGNIQTRGPVLWAGKEILESWRLVIEDPAVPEVRLSDNTVQRKAIEILIAKPCCNFLQRTADLLITERTLPCAPGNPVTTGPTMTADGFQETIVDNGCLRIITRIKETKVPIEIPGPERIRETRIEVPVPGPERIVYRDKEITVIQTKKPKSRKWLWFVVGGAAAGLCAWKCRKGRPAPTGEPKKPDFMPPVNTGRP